MEGRPFPLWQRLMVGLLFPAFVLSALWYAYIGGKGLRCGFYALSGYYCPGCGSGRAVHAMLHGHFREMFSYNVLLLPLGLPCTIVLLHEYLRIVFPALHLRPVQVPQALSNGAVGLLLIYWVLRNLPAFSFLAPGG